MCTGGRQLADIQTGTFDRPEVPDIVGTCLTTTVEGLWVVWAHKLARPAGDEFLPMAGGGPYPRDAVASCRLYGRPAMRTHDAPEPGCTCGFHALSEQWPYSPKPGLVALEVILSGRVLAFEWGMGGVLFRAARQTVVRVDAEPEAWRPAPATRRPDDPEGHLALVARCQPRSSGPVQAQLPRIWPPAVVVSEHSGYCSGREQDGVDRRAPLLVSA